MQTLQSFLQTVKRLSIRSVTFGGKIKKQDGQETTTTQVSNKEKQSDYKEPAYIRASVTYHQMYDGKVYREVHDFEWVGSKYAPAYISSELWARNPSWMKMIPWPLKVISKPGDSFLDSYEVVRKDVGFHLWWIAYYLYHKSRGRWYYWWKSRVIFTFEVWGLAYQPEAEMLSWKNIGRKRKKR
jgi:hypothetical protein